MANPSKAKGTTYENSVLQDLQSIWPGASRSSTNTQSNDFHGCAFPIEAKKRAAWALKDWIRKVVAVAPPSHYAPGERFWAIYASEGDKRKADSIPDVVVFPRFFGTMLLKHYYESKA